MSTAADELQAAISKMAKSPMVAMSGHGGTLKTLSDYIGEQERRLAALEAQVKQLQGMGGAVDQFKLGMVL